MIINETEGRTPNNIGNIPNMCGAYCLINDNDEKVYCGHTSDLQQCIRNRRYNHEITFSTVEIFPTKTLEEANEIANVLICKYAPILNSPCKIKELRNKEESWYAKPKEIKANLRYLISI